MAQSEERDASGVSPSVVRGLMGRGKGRSGPTKWGYVLVAIGAIIGGGLYFLLDLGGSVLLFQSVATFPDGGQTSFEADGSTYVVSVDGRDVGDGGVEGGDARCDITDTNGVSRLSGVGQLLGFTSASGSSVGTFAPAAGPVTISCSVREALLELDLPFGDDEYAFRVAPVNGGLLSGMYIALGAAVLFLLGGVALLVIGAVSGGRRAVAAAGLPPDAMAQGRALLDAHRRGELPSAPATPTPTAAPAPTPTTDPLMAPVEGVTWHTYLHVEMTLYKMGVAAGSQDEVASRMGIPAGRWQAIADTWRARVHQDPGMRARYTTDAAAYGS